MESTSSRPDNLRQTLRDLNHELSIAHGLGTAVLDMPGAFEDIDSVRAYYERLHQELPGFWRLVVDMEGRRNIVAETIAARKA